MHDNCDPHRHMKDVAERFDALIEYLRADIEKVQEPKVQAIFESMAEVLTGLRTICAHYEESMEAGMHR